MEALDGRDMVGSFFCVARSIFCFIRVVVFGVDSLVVHYILKPVIHKSTTTSVIMLFRGAINQLLFREGSQISSRNGNSTFSRSSRGKRPATTAVSLILHWSDGIFSPPIDGIQSSFWKFHHSISACAVERLEVNRRKLVNGQICKLVHTHTKRTFFRVVTVDKLNIFRVNLGAKVMFCSVKVALSKDLFPFFPTQSFWYSCRFKHKAKLLGED